MVALSIPLAGAISSYADLVSAIGTWLDRDDLEDEIPSFINLFETRANRELRTLWQVTRLTVDVSQSGYALPSDFRQLKRLSLIDTYDRPLFEMSPQSIAQRFDGNTGCVKAYYIEGRTLYLMPPPDGTVTLDMTYLGAIPALTAANQTNWLLTEHPDAYLFGAMLEAAVYVRDDEAVQYLADRVSDTITSIRRASRLDSYGGGPIIPQSPLQVRGGRC